MWGGCLEVGPEGTACCGQDTVLSQMGMLRLMQAGCGARFCVLHVAHDLLRLGVLELGVSVSEASLPQFSCGCSVRVLGDTTRNRMN